MGPLLHRIAEAGDGEVGDVLGFEVLDNRAVRPAHHQWNTELPAQIGENIPRKHFLWSRNYYVAFGQEQRTLGEYIDWAVDQASRMNELDLKVEGETDEDKAASLVDAMLGAGLAEKV